jgi:hypothetical protein
MILLILKSWCIASYIAVPFAYKMLLGKGNKYAILIDAAIKDLSILLGRSRVGIQIGFAIAIAIIYIVVCPIFTVLLLGGFIKDKLK